MECKHPDKWCVHRFMGNCSIDICTKAPDISSAPDIWYHGTSENRWKEIQAEGVLWGKLDNDSKLSRVTYLASEPEDAMRHGDVLLKVYYVPKGSTLQNPIDNYVDGCWQIRVYVPIPLTQVTRVIS